MIFGHDHIFLIDENNKIYSPGKLSNSSFDRYIQHFNDVKIISRFKVTSSAEIPNGYTCIDRNDISFLPFENQSTFSNRFIKRRYFKSLIHEIIENDPYVVVRLPSEIGFLISEVCISLGKPYVCEVVACPVDAMVGLNSFKSKLYKNIIKRSMRHCVANAAGAIYVTDSFLQDRYPNYKLSVSASNVEIDCTADTPRQLKTKDQFIITHVGNLDSPHKGYDTIYKALTILDKNIDKKILVNLVGGGHVFIKKIKLKNIQVVFTGSLNKDDLFDLLDLTDIYIQPSNQEGLPRATIEAMSRGLPCIVSDAGGLPELINTKLIHPIDDYKKLASLIKDLLSDSELYNNESEINLLKSKRYLKSELTKVRLYFFDKYIELFSNEKI